LFTMVCCFCFNCLGFPENIWNNVMFENASTNEGMEKSAESSGSVCLVSLHQSMNETVHFGSKYMAEGVDLRDLSVIAVPEKAGVEPNAQVLQSTELEKEIQVELSDDIQYLQYGFSVKQLSRLDASWTPAPLKLPSCLTIEDCKRTVEGSRRSSAQTLHSTLSDWGELFDGLKSHDFTESGSLLMQLGVSGSLSGLQTAQESRLSIVFSPKKIKLPPGKVMGMFISKNDYLFQILNLNSSLNEVVDLFLFKENGVRLPIGFSKTEANQSRIMSIKKMRNTLAENLGPLFDAKNQGLVFVTGHVNSKLCYKMSSCDLSKIERIFSFLSSENLLER